ncbi:MAG: bifunctional riboflavin kinase/FAD synthetase [Mariprofundaceae bacterium]|nr:bifunctional riboflavin kinase/FAD synthetase [Mariprofundaceae bacterium]
MKVLRSFAAATQQNFKQCAITIGNFDGVHMGHQQVLAELKGHAVSGQHLGAQACPAVVVTFEPHPRAFLFPAEAPRRLSHLHERLEALKQAGVDAVLLLHFNQQLASMSATDFMQTLHQSLSFKHIHVGYDFAFGKDRQGQADMMRKLGDQQGFTVSEAAAFTMLDGIVSSSRIRSAIEAADFTLTEKLLGRAYAISGRVGHGEKRGREMGFPTANLNVKNLTHPPVGIYAAWAEWDGKRVKAAAYLGYRPTFHGRTLLLETHLLNHQENVYGKRLKVSFVQRIREDRAFINAELLAQQIQSDCQAAHHILDNDGSPLQK